MSRNDDRAFSAHRRPPGSESQDPRPDPPGGYGQPAVAYVGQESLPVNDHNWLALNSTSISKIEVNPSPYRDWDAELSAHGHNPRYGDFTFKSAWKDRDRLRSWADKYLPEAEVSYKMRDGGY